jgi:hypothetical protein
LTEDLSKGDAVRVTHSTPTGKQKIVHGHIIAVRPDRFQVRHIVESGRGKEINVSVRETWYRRESVKRSPIEVEDAQVIMKRVMMGLGFSL